MIWVRARGKKVTITINIINIQQYITDLRTLNKNKLVSLFFFVYIKIASFAKKTCIFIPYRLKYIRYLKAFLQL